MIGKYIIRVVGILNLFYKNKPAPQPVQLPKPKVLVVDDDQFLREFYVELLSKEGYQVFGAVNGKTGLEAVTVNKPGVVILDIMMPIIDGNEVLRRLWNDPQTKNIPVIILTNAGNINNMDNAKFYSAYKFLIKTNVTPEEIIESVKEALIKNYNWENPKYYLNVEKQ